MGQGNLPLTSMPTAREQLEQLEKERKEEEAIMAAPPVVRDLGIDKHINYEEIKPQVDKAVSLMSEKEKILYYSIKSKKK